MQYIDRTLVLISFTELKFDAFRKWKKFFWEKYALLAIWIIIILMDSTRRGLCHLQWDNRKCHSIFYVMWVTFLRQRFNFFSVIHFTLFLLLFRVNRMRAHTLEFLKSITHETPSHLVTQRISEFYRLCVFFYFGRFSCMLKVWSYRYGFHISTFMQFIRMKSNRNRRNETEKNENWSIRMFFSMSWFVVSN